MKTMFKIGKNKYIIRTLCKYGVVRTFTESYSRML